MLNNHITRLAAALFVVLMPARSAFACMNGMEHSSAGLGLPAIWCAGLVLHLLMMPALSGSLTVRLGWFGGTLGASTLVGLGIGVPVGFGAAWLSILVLMASIATLLFHITKGRDWAREQERRRAETAPQVFE